MSQLKVLHECSFSGKQLANLKVYEDPFGGTELCIDLCFSDGQIACLSIGPGKPKIVSTELCREVNHKNGQPRDYRMERTMLGWRIK